MAPKQQQQEEEEYEDEYEDEYEEVDAEELAAADGASEMTCHHQQGRGGPSAQRRAQREGSAHSQLR